MMKMKQVDAIKTIRPWHREAKAAGDRGAMPEL